MDTKAVQVQRLLANEGFMTELDEAGSIGRRYARADEAGVQLGVTIDYDTFRRRNSNGQGQRQLAAGANANQRFA